MAETWAHCDVCARWYYCPAATITGHAVPACPACQTPPSRVRRDEPATPSPA